jgi:cell division protein FtsW
MIKTQFIPDRAQSRPADTVLIILIVLLTGLGLGALFSASHYRAFSVFGNPYYFIKRQCAWAVLGGILAWAFSRVPLKFLWKITPVFFGGSLVLMVLCFVPAFAPQIMGARRWIVLFGYSVQPSEFAKVALVLYLARILHTKDTRLNDFINTFIPLVCVVGLFAVLTYAQNDFSTAVFLLLLGISIFFIAGIKLRYVWGLSFFAGLGGLAVLLTKGHRVQRIMTFLNPGRDPTGADYQILAARTALLKGGFWGTGIGQGTRKLGGLPEAHSDFIFAVLAEELGFIGVMGVLIVFLALAYKGYAIARNHNGNRYAFYLAFGATTCILSQTLMNMAVVAGLVPATGVTLPFFSSGGSSLLVTLILCGILVNLSRPDEAQEDKVYG